MNATYRKNEGAVAERLVRGEVMLVPIRSEIGQMGRVFDLNPTATRIWELAKQGQSEAQMAAALAAEYEVGPEEALADVRAALETLVSVGALVRTA